MDKVFTIIQLVLAILLIVIILLQQRGSGLGAAFGSGGNIYGTRRGVDKTLFQITIVVSILFFVAAVLNLMF